MSLNQGIMNFYIMINYRKIRSKNKSKENYIKIPLKEVGLISPKKYSLIIVNDIKMDFSINLSKKTFSEMKSLNSSEVLNKLSSKKIKKENKAEIMKEKSEEIRKNNNTILMRKKALKMDSQIYTKKKIESRTPIINRFQKATRIISAINRIKNIKNNYNYNNNSNNMTYNYNIYNNLINKKVSESHQQLDVEDNFLSQKITYKRKKTIDGDAKNKSAEKLNNNKTYQKRNTSKNIENKKIIEKTNINISKTKKEENKENNLLFLSDILNPKITETKSNLSYLIRNNTIEDIEQIEEIFLNPINKEKPIKKNRETFCEGFFIASFPLKKGQVVEKSQTFPALCGHKECSSLPSMQPEIIYRYPLKDTKTLELNNLAASICFPTGIKVCYDNEKGPGIINDYVTPITNQKGERYYMITYHFYLRMENLIYNNKYEMHPLKDHLKRYLEKFIDFKEDAVDKEKEKIEEDLEKAQNLGFREYVYIPYCICLISKYPYVDEIKDCLQSIYYLISEKKEKNKKNKKELINEFIMHLINSVPIPEIETMVQFYIPYNTKNEIKIKYPKLNDLNIMNTSISNLLKYFSIDLIIIIFRFLLFEKKVLFIDDDYTRLSNVTDNFISLLYPFKWMHTYIPIMSDQMLPYLQTFLPFINGISENLLPLVKELYQTGDMEQNEEIFFIYIKENKFRLGSHIIGNNKKKYKYLDENVNKLPNNLEKYLKNKLKKIKEEIETYEKRHPGNKNMEEFDIKIRITFIEVFVQMFYDIDKYLVLLDEDIIFNKNLFLEKIDKNNKKFFDEFTDTQLFQLFTQNIVKDDFNYFKIMVEDYNKNNKNFTYDNDKAKDNKIFNVKKLYIISPNYLGIDDKNKETIMNKINKNYNLKEKENTNKQITEYMKKIEEKKYDNKNLDIYVIPKEMKSRKIQFNRNLINNILANKNLLKHKEGKKMNKIKNKDEMNEKEQDELKERIKDFTVKIFKSEEFVLDNSNNLRKEILNDLNTNIGRDFFVNLISKNTNNVILLQDESFSLLGNIIYNILLCILQIAENDIILEEIVKLLISLNYFSKEDTGDICMILKGKKKCNITLWDLYKQRIQVYPKVNQANLWHKWYQIDLDKEKEKDNIDTKKNNISDLINIMFDLELDITFIKKTIEGIIINVFGENEEIKKEFTEKIQNIYLKNKKNKK